MPTGTIPSYLPTSKENALYSLYKYLVTQFGLIVPTSPPLPAPLIIDLAYEQATKYPNITITDLGMSRFAELAMGRAIAIQQYGRQEQTLVEFLIQDMDNPTAATAYTSAELNCRRMRDQLKFCLENSGMMDLVTLQPVPAQILPVIRLLDHNSNDADTGSFVWHERGQANGWSETFLRTKTEQPNLKQYRCTAKIYWIQKESANNPS